MRRHPAAGYVSGAIGAGASWVVLGC